MKIGLVDPEIICFKPLNKSPKVIRKECVALAPQKNVPTGYNKMPKFTPKNCSFLCSHMHCSHAVFHEYSMHVIQNTGFSSNIPSMTYAVHSGCMLSESGHHIVRPYRVKHATGQWNVLGRLWKYRDFSIFQHGRQQPSWILKFWKS